MPLWESNELYMVAGLSLFVTLGAVASFTYFVYKRSVANGRRADEEQAALEKVLLRKGEAITTSPPTKPLIVSPSFSSPNKVPARHLRSGSYSPTHYLSPYHSRQPRRNSSPTSTISSIQQPKLPNLQLHHHHPQLQLNEADEQFSYTDESQGTTSTSVSPTKKRYSNVCVPLIKPNLKQDGERQDKSKGSDRKRGNVKGSLAHCNSQYYGTIPPRRFPGRHGVAPADTNFVGNVPAFLPSKCVVQNLKQKTIKGDYVPLPGTDAPDFHDHGNWKSKDEIGAKEKNIKINHNCSPEAVDDIELRRKLLLQKQHQQKLQLQQIQNHMLPNQYRLSTQPPGELFKMKHTVTEEIPYYISTQ